MDIKQNLDNEDNFIFVKCIDSSGNAFYCDIKNILEPIIQDHRSDINMLKSMSQYLKNVSEKMDAIINSIEK